MDKLPPKVEKFCFKSFIKATVIVDVLLLLLLLFKRQRYEPAIQGIFFNKFFFIFFQRMLESPLGRNWWVRIEANGLEGKRNKKLYIIVN